MILRSLLISGCALFLGACGTSAKYETVSVRMGSLSCSENIKVDSSGRSGLNYRNESGSLSFNLTGPTTIPGSFKFTKRCQEMLETMNTLAKIRADLEISGAQISMKRNEEELQRLKGTDDSMFSEDY